VWGWLLRDQGHVAFADRPGEAQPRVIIASLEWQPTLDEALTNYERRRYTLSTTWSDNPFTWSAFIEWLLYRYSDVPPISHEFAVYIRQ
jgi:hypothetical protein